METRYIDDRQIIELLNEADNVEYKLIPRKKVMYQALLPNGQSKCVCIVTSKFHDTIDGYWVDHTQKQKTILDSFDSAIVFFVLQGLKCAKLDWAVLGLLLTDDCVIYNEKEGNHWKTYIRNGKVEIRGGNKHAVDIIQLKVD